MDLATSRFHKPAPDQDGLHQGSLASTNNELDSTTAFGGRWICLFGAVNQKSSKTKRINSCRRFSRNIFLNGNGSFDVSVHAPILKKSKAMVEKVESVRIPMQDLEKRVFKKGKICRKSVGKM